MEKYFKPSAADTHTTCGWKGVASYLDLHLDDGTVRPSSWCLDLDLPADGCMR